jgi:hypothetical protein
MFFFPGKVPSNILSLNKLSSTSQMHRKQRSSTPDEVVVLLFIIIILKNENKGMYWVLSWCV